MPVPRTMHILSSALVLVLAACAVGPNYIKPAPPQASSFRNTAAASARVAAAAPELATWWRGFGDPELAGLVERALRQNLDLAQADARVSQARARARGAGAALLPAGQVDGRAAFSRQSIQTPLGRAENSFPGFDRNQSLYDISAGVSWEPDVFGGLRRTAEAARAQYQASQAARAASQLTVAAETADAYVLVRTFQARLAVARAQSESQRRLVRLVSLQFSRGIVPRLQRDQTAGALAGVEATIPVLEAGLEAELDRLEVLVGADIGSLHAELMVGSDIPTPPGVDSAGGPASLVRRRPDVIAAERALAASDARIGAAISNYYPKSSLSGLLGFESGSAGNLFTSAAFQPQGLLGVRWRLFDFGRVKAEVDEARGSRAEALAAYRQSLLNATSDVETALVALVDREKQAQTLRSGEASLAQARTSAGAAYTAGQVSLIEVIDADERLLATRDQRVQAQSEVARAAIACFKALGGGWTA